MQASIPIHDVWTPLFLEFLEWKLIFKREEKNIFSFASSVCTLTKLKLLQAIYNSAIAAQLRYLYRELIYRSRCQVSYTDDGERVADQTLIYWKTLTVTVARACTVTDEDWNVLDDITNETLDFCNDSHFRELFTSDLELYGPTACC